MKYDPTLALMASHIAAGLLPKGYNRRETAYHAMEIACEILDIAERHQQFQEQQSISLVKKEGHRGSFIAHSTPGTPRGNQSPAQPLTGAAVRD